MEKKQEVIISVKNLVKRFSNRVVLDDISFDIYKGEIFVIMGGSGCGKSTLLRHLIGALKPDSGSVFIKSKDLSKTRSAELDALKRSFGMLFQSAALLDSLTVRDNVSLPLREHTKLAENIIRIIVKMKLSLLGLQDFEDHLPSELSGGMRKRVGLARAIALDPEIVFYDEPTSGLDPVVTAVIDELVIDLSKKLLFTSVVVSHDMNSVFRIADRVAMLHKGRILALGTPKEIKNSDNEIVRQFIQGSTKGPINFFKSDEVYLSKFAE